MDSIYDPEYSRSESSYYRSHDYRQSSSVSNLTYREIISATSSTVPYSFEVFSSDEITSTHSLDYSYWRRKEDEEEEQPSHETPEIRRRNSSPIKPLTEIEEYKMSRPYYYLEKAAEYSSQILISTNNKFDIDTQEGQRACRKFLTNIECLVEEMKIPIMNRKYITKFSKAYRILYKEDSLCYLIEILDSAQEAFPYLWVNGEKYDFSQTVINYGAALYQEFCKLKQGIRKMYNKILNEPITTSIVEITHYLYQALEEFDKKWAIFEQSYVMELMIIESEARKYIIKAIKLDMDITQYEEKEHIKGKIILEGEEFYQLRDKLIQIIGKINSVANTEGKGRDDLNNDILVAAEKASRKVSTTQSKAVRSLANSIKSSFKDLRELLKKYSQNIESVDPQLKNNPDLVEALVNFEVSWEKGKDYLLSSKKFDDLINFSQLIEGVTEKYPQILGQVESMDASIFLSLPCMLVLKCIDTKEFSILICLNHQFECTEKDKLIKLSSLYSSMQKKCSEYELYNILEESLLEISSVSSSAIKDQLDEFIQLTKVVAMEVQRFNPTEWNGFLMASLGRVGK